MIRALIATAATAAVSSAVYFLYRSGKLDSLASALGNQFWMRHAPTLDSAYGGANASKPAEPHPWPVDRKSLAGTDMAAHAA